MARTDFDRELTTLMDELLSLGSMVQKSLLLSLDALKTRDLKLSKKVIEEDDEIDSKAVEIEEKCIDLMATQQPLAGDLRTIVTFMLVSSELERMGDYAEGIAKIGLRIGEEALLKPLIDIPRIGDLASNMLRLSLETLVSRDVEGAKQVILMDDDVDALYNQIYRELVLMMIENPKNIQRATYLLWVAHDLERIADRATNISERTIFMVTGEKWDISDR
ncbi:MAG: phosphate signaling complex protein PhoU [Dehalococcoidia bacterium]|nr:phosphate transport system regulatory protein PhoU [Chloroflexota bacterium]|tara:strand:+ start:880 stop:1539 length:660 start_codon:yes stop_codon:yes gene_type:complete